VLTIAALRLGASYVTAVDVDAEVLVTAAQNCALNDNLDERVEFLHVREVCA
jgi:23S rRNA G2069 N7-methylase RlmK/C1962 C5-methylase RlmI